MSTGIQQAGTITVDFRGRSAIVTGAAGIIGSAVARRLAGGGANLCLTDRGDLSSIVEELKGARCKVIACPADVSESRQVAEVVQRAVSAFGQIDILVTVAGVTSFGSIEDIGDAEWDRVQAINLKGVFLCNRAVVALMKAHRYGRIINIGSVLAKNGGNPRPWLDPAEQARAGNVAYGAAKAGVHALTLYLAKEVASYGVTVNAVAPGPIASPMTTTLPETLIRQIPVGRMGAAAEVAAAVTFLAAEESAFINGEILDVNGGLWMD
jgi:3-oxoacyl-[acyl-carrier protein] reductase